MDAAKVICPKIGIAKLFFAARDFVFIFYGVPFDLMMATAVPYYWFAPVQRS